VRLLQDVFTSWGSERCDKIRLLAESFHDCPLSISFLVKEENEKGAKSPIKYTWMASAAFRSMEDSLRIHVLERFASGSVLNTEHARSIIRAVPLAFQAISHLQEVCHFSFLLLFSGAALLCPHLPFFLLEFIYLLCVFVVCTTFVYILAGCLFLLLCKSPGGV
jgi:hypothetical protein